MIWHTLYEGNGASETCATPAAVVCDECGEGGGGGVGACKDLDRRWGMRVRPSGGLEHRIPHIGEQADMSHLTDRKNPT